MPAQLALRGVSKSYADRRVLDHVALTVAPGERLGIVGENGSGKSTLLRIAAGAEAPDDGEVTLQADGGVGYLGQTLAIPLGHTISQAIDAALSDLRAIEHRLRELETDLTTGAALTEYGDLMTIFELRGGYDADARTDKALEALGLGRLDRSRTLGSLSGGERSRLGLACLLAAAPEVMLLDEPTNHLDAASTTWLEDRLREHRGTLVVVSHDRIFLERVVTAIAEVQEGGIVRYGGGYGGYLAERVAARRRWEQAYAEWCEEIARLEEHAATTARQVAPGRVMKDRNKVAYDRDAGRVQSSVSSRVRQAAERLRRLRDDPVPEPPEPLRFAPPRQETGTARAEMRGVRVGDRLFVEHFAIEAGERVLVHGPNGAGKSTFLRVLAGELAPDAGTVTTQGRVGHLHQDPQVVRPERSLLEAFAAGRPGYADDHRAALLALGLFRPEVLATPVGALSVGQRQRLALARLLTAGADLLLLDEPTNHLSPGLVEDLEAALDGYRGALLMVSHDRALRSRFTGRELAISPPGAPA
jgi:macrolide transport system ATP-binding/permease protein